MGPTGAAIHRLVTEKIGLAAGPVGAEMGE